MPFDARRRDRALTVKYSRCPLLHHRVRWDGPNALAARTGSLRQTSLLSIQLSIESDIIRHREG